MFCDHDLRVVRSTFDARKKFTENSMKIVILQLRNIPSLLRTHSKFTSTEFLKLHECIVYFILVYTVIGSFIGLSKYLKHPAVTKIKDSL